MNRAPHCRPLLISVVILWFVTTVAFFMLAPSLSPEQHSPGAFHSSIGRNIVCSDLRPSLGLSKLAD